MFFGVGSSSSLTRLVAGERVEGTGQALDFCSFGAGQGFSAGACGELGEVCAE